MLFALLISIHLALAAPSSDTLDSIVRASQNGIDVEAIARAARSAGTWDLTDDQVVQLLRAGVDPIVIQAMTNDVHPTDEDLSAAKEDGPAYTIAAPKVKEPEAVERKVERQRTVEVASRVAAEQWSVALQEHDARVRSTGSFLTWTGVAVGVASAIGYAVFSGKAADGDFDAAVPAAICGVGIGVGISWTGAGLAIGWSVPPRASDE